MTATFGGAFSENCLCCVQGGWINAEVRKVGQEKWVQNSYEVTGSEQVGECIIFVRVRI
jgi:hypothetical protein